MGSPPVRKQKRCRVCGGLFTPYLTLQVACSVSCAKTYGAANNKALLKRGQKVERAELVKERRAFRKQSMSLSKLKNLAQREFNKFIRARDEGNPCISCGRLTGAKVNAGHYRTTAAAGHLRYDERQVWLQCEHCNTYLSGNQVEYRKALVAKLGAEVVESIDNDNRVHHWTREELTEIRKRYHDKWRALLAAREGRQ